MRILFWSETFWPRIGGVEVLGARLVRALQARGHELVVVTRQEIGEGEAPPGFEGVPIHRMPFRQAIESKDPARIAALQARVRNLKRALRPDLVHVYHAAFEVMFHLATKDVARAPTLLTLHAPYPEEVLGPRDTIGRALRSAAWIAACSRAVADRVSTSIPEIADRVTVIWNGLEPSPMPPAPLRADPPRLLCLGRLAPEKGFDLALSALAELLDRFPTARLTIAGDGRARTALEERARDLGIAHAVDFLGWVPPEEVDDHIDEATVVVVPSRCEEGFGLVAAEAAARARPIVAARTGSLPEIVRHGETGLLVEPDDGSALADAITRILEAPESAARMGEAGARWAGESFAWVRYVDAYDALIRQLAVGAGSGSNGGTEGARPNQPSLSRHPIQGRS